MLKNEKGFSFLGMLLSLVIVIIIAFSAYKYYGKAGKNPITGANVDPKTAAIAVECNAKMKEISRHIATFAGDERKYPSSISEVIDADSAVGDIVNDDTLWTEDGRPEIEDTTDNSYTMSAVCKDNNIYTYDSAKDKVSAVPVGEN